MCVFFALIKYSKHTFLDRDRVKKLGGKIKYHKGRLVTYDLMAFFAWLSVFACVIDFGA